MYYGLQYLRFIMHIFLICSQYLDHIVFAFEKKGLTNPNPISGLAAM